MSVTRLGIHVPYDYDREAEPVLTEFRHFIDSDDVDATFNVYESTDGNGALIGWDLEAVGLVTWHRADSLEEATAWVYSEVTPWRTTEGDPLH
jgi:hypothetical protein